MRDPFPIPPPPAIAEHVQALANKAGLQVLHLHFHEVVFAFLLYHVTYKYISPVISRIFFPQIYTSFNARTKLNWDVHVVSFVQSTLINILALYVMWQDKERAGMDWRGKVLGYTGGSGLIQGMATGYFVWDLVITVQHLEIFGVGMLAHAISALFVFSLGFRPFVNYYAPVFILYELSSPFLNIHWFCDKLNLTGGRFQLVNGIMLLLTFFSARLVYGTYQSVRVFSDIYQTIRHNSVLTDPEVGKAAPLDDVMQFAGERAIPLWLPLCYLASNLTLNGLNWFWFEKMIATLRKRFDPPFGTRKPEIKLPEKVPEEEMVLVEGTALATPGVNAADESGKDYISSVQVEKAGSVLKVQQTEVRNRTARRRG
ncbi:DUF887-domain-containing protein [Westerdykella ornata]|uniref:DUF887-domain-containing protein n=1 Tax=Westerdykella ornata TaxID=318751 RepID=A0A6A6JDJ6_WESOR|nr:DUF887-domain-containing protein [Westerdykella ornata]KAF2274680.1 DUF887-domain-containing protein [Westerdykella ornata]